MKNGLLLLRVHRAFIAVCILFLLGYAFFEVRHGGWGAWRAGLSVLAAALLGLYLRAVRRS